MNAIENYIAQFPEPIQVRLHKIREIILSRAEGAVEIMAYGMPGYKLYNTPLVYFAAFSHHIGFYATPTGHTRFQNELSAYKQGKGSVQFPHQQPIPYALIEQIVLFAHGSKLLSLLVVW